MNNGDEDGKSASQRCGKNTNVLPFIFSFLNLRGGHNPYFWDVLRIKMQKDLVHSVKSWIPNVITLMNLMMGCLGVSLAAWGDLVGACRAVMLAALMDLFDGMAARALHVTSPLGKDLDSLADVVSFGLVPALILYQLASSAPGVAGTEWVVYLHTLAAALRLARFNQDTQQKSHFIGLASPAAALLLVSAVAYLGQNEPLSLELRSGLTKFLIYGAASFTALLMLVPLPMPSLKSMGKIPTTENSLAGKRHEPAAIGDSENSAEPIVPATAGENVHSKYRTDLWVLGASAFAGFGGLWALSPYAGIFCVLSTYILLSTLRLFVYPKSLPH